MTDRELIELAAKAAGIDVYESTDGTIQNRPVLVFSGGGQMGTMPYEVRWNPLIDDAQAFRLAVKLGLMMEWCRIDSYTMDGKGYGVVLQWPPGGIKNRIISEVSEFQADPYAATRRAITMAAAEIAKERTS